MSGAAIALLAPVVEVDGRALSRDINNNLIGLRVSTALRLPGRATLEFLDEGFELSASETFKIGAKIEIGTANGPILFTGYVTGVELDIEHGAPNLTVTADDAAYRLTLGNRVRTFAAVTYSEIATKIAQENQIPVATTKSSSPQDYVLQSDTDFGFLSEIADRAGYDWWVDEKGKLQFHPMGSRGEPTRLAWSGKDGTLTQFSVKATGLHPTKVTARSWNPSNQSEIAAVNEVSVPGNSSNFVRPYVQAKELDGNRAVTTSHLLYATQSDGTALTRSASARVVATSVVATGLCSVNPAIAVGTDVTVSEVGPASGTYAVTEVEHIYDSRGFLTRFTAGDRAPSGLVDTLAAPIPSSFRADMLVVGVVTNINGDDKHPGHVKVKFPTFGDQIESAWARVLSVGAGESRGMTFLPEVNDEVVIGFEGGDVTRPVVLGGIYSSKKAARDYGTKDGKVHKRQIVSRLGHAIELGDGDKPADKRIALTLADAGYSVNLSMEGLTAQVPAGKPVTVSAGDTKIEFDKQGNIVMSGKKVTIKAVGAVEISGMTVALKANTSVEASGATVKLAGSGMAELSSGGATSVKGATVAIN